MIATRRERRSSQPFNRGDESRRALPRRRRSGSASVRVCPRATADQPQFKPIPKVATAPWLVGLGVGAPPRLNSPGKPITKEQAHPESTSANAGFRLGVWQTTSCPDTRRKAGLLPSRLWRFGAPRLSSRELSRAQAGSLRYEWTNP
jgi:hypothetical protein